MIVKMLVKLFIDAKLAFRSKNLSVHFIREDAFNLIDHLLDLRVSTRTVNQSYRFFPLKLWQLLLNLSMMFHESNACSKKANCFATTCGGFKNSILAILAYSFKNLNDVLLLAQIRILIRKPYIDSIR